LSEILDRGDFLLNNRHETIDRRIFDRELRLPRLPKTFVEEDAFLWKKTKSWLPSLPKLW